MMSNSHYNLAITRARQLSKRAAIGWSVIGEKSNILHSDACMAGLEYGNLEQAITQFSNEATELFLTCEPISPLFNVRRLILGLEKSRIDKIVIGKRFNAQIADPVWHNWLFGWQGTVNYLPFNPIIEKLCFGIEMLKYLYRPWITSVTAADFSGISQPLGNFISEFGFLNHLSDLSQQSRAILYWKSQHIIIDKLPIENFMGEPIEYYEIAESEQMSSILRHCANENRCSILALCDMPMLANLIDAQYVDEAVHHLTNINATKSKNSEHAQQLVEHHALNWNDWTLHSNSVVGQCSRITLCRHSPAPDLLYDLRNRLN